MLAQDITIDIPFFLDSFPREGTHSDVRTFRLTFKLRIQRGYQVPAFPANYIVS